MSSSPEHTPHTHALVPSRVLVTYMIMGGVSVAASFFFWDRSPLNDPAFEGVPNPNLDLGLGLGLGVAVVLFDRLLEVIFPLFRRMAEEFRLLIGPMNHSKALLFAFSSSIGEELLFRGTLLPWLGLAASSILFGLVHIPPNRRLWPWPLLAIGMGFAFGWLFQYTGNLLAPILAHFTINYFGFVRLSKGTS